jgi:acid phosphatase (class A)
MMKSKLMSFCLTSILALSMAIAPLGFKSIAFAADPQVVAQHFYFDPSSVDLSRILAPPPLPDSPAGKADLQAVLDAQRTRTPAEVASAEADAQISIFRFADVMGSGFKPENLPFATTFFAHVVSDGRHPIDIVKAHFNRPRPFVADPEVKPIVHEPANASYPSGHATFAYLAAILLANMVPEKTAAIFERAALFAHNRVVAGVHYPTDVEAGRICGSVIGNVLLTDPHFMPDFGKARSEVRHALGLSDLPTRANSIGIDHDGPS